MHHATDVTYLFYREVTAPDPMGLFAVEPGMFFRPEEDALFSKGFDDTGFLRPLNVYVGNKDHRTRAVFPMNGRFQVAGDFHFHGLGTVSAGGANGHG